MRIFLCPIKKGRMGFETCRKRNILIYSFMESYHDPHDPADSET